MGTDIHINGQGIFELYELHTLKLQKVGLL